MRKIGKGYKEIFPGFAVKEYPLMTKRIENLLAKNPIGSHDRCKNLMNAEVITAYYTPFHSGRWVIIEGDKMPNGDFILFGYCHILEWEWGCVYLSEIQDLMDTGIYVERDLHCKGKRVKDLLY